MDELLRKLRYYFRRRQFDAELAEEMEFHRAQSGAKRFGNVTRLQEDSRAAWSWTWLDDLAQDVRHGLVSFRRAPLYTVVVVLTLALGIGATTSIFSVMNAAVLRPLPFPDSDRLVRIFRVHLTEGWDVQPRARTMRAWASESRLFETIARGMQGGGATEFHAAGKPIRAGNVSLDTFSLLGTPPLLGRWYRPDEVMSGLFASTIVISHGAWQRLFDGDEDVIGKPIPGWDQPWGGTVIGVMPPGFWVTPDGADLDAWYATDHRQAPPTAQLEAVWGRLKPGVSPEQAEQELAAIYHVVNEDNPRALEFSIEVEPLRDWISGPYTPALYLLLGGVVFVLLVGAGLMFNSYVRLLGVDLGFDRDELVTMSINLVTDRRHVRNHDSTRTEILPEMDTFFNETLNRIAPIPGVGSVGMLSLLPLAGGYAVPAVGTGPQDQPAAALYQEVSPDAFRAIGIPLVEGRFFTDFDTGSAPPVAIVNQLAARQLFPGGSPIGQVLRMPVRRYPGILPDREVVGVVGDTLINLRPGEAAPTIFIPYLQHIRDYPEAGLAWRTARKDFVIRTPRSDPDLVKAVSAAVAAVDPDVPVEVMSYRQRMSPMIATETLLARMLGTFSGLAVLLAALGLYGVIAYSVAQQTHEFGIRTALGARRADILRMVVRQGLGITAIGVVFGVGASLALTRVMENQLPLYEITPTDPATLVAVAIGLFVVALAACWLPAWRASNQSASMALRAE